jgi:MerR family transcriptional regulator, mercuric resistance operon regulatory protein
MPGQFSAAAGGRRDTAALTRGALAARTGCNVETVRYYERIGLLPAPPRSAGGHRLYGPDLVKRLTFVRKSRDLGFTIEEIRDLLTVVDGGAYTCAQVQQMARDHARRIRHKIADLRRLERVFETMVAQCSGGDVPECPIIDALFEPLKASEDGPAASAAAG